MVSFHEFLVGIWMSFWQKKHNLQVYVCSICLQSVTRCCRPAIAVRVRSTNFLLVLSRNLLRNTSSTYNVDSIALSQNYFASVKSDVTHENSALLLACRACPYYIYRNQYLMCPIWTHLSPYLQNLSKCGHELLCGKPCHNR